MKTLSKEIEVFAAGKLVRIQMGLLACIADRPEKHVVLNETQGGMFGKHSLWFAFIGCKHLPLCCRSFDKEIKHLLDNRDHEDSLFCLPSCRYCCK